MDCSYNHIQRRNPLNHDNFIFPNQDGPQCKVHVLSVAHHMLCECGEFPTYSRNNPRSISVRKIAKHHDSVVGEVTSIDMLTLISRTMGLNIEVHSYVNDKEFQQLLNSTFEKKSVAILFLQYDGIDYPALEGSAESQHQYYEHAVVAIGWSPAPRQEN